MPYQNTFPEHERREKPPGMTKEQLDYFTEQTVKAVEKGTRNGVRHYRNRAVIGFLILLLGLVAVRWADNERANEAVKDRVATANAQRAAIVKSGNVVAVDGCNGRFRDRVEIRSVLQSSKDFLAREYKKGNITEARFKESSAFYDERLSGLPLPDCRKAANILTTDPNKVLPVPDPLYPGHDKTKGSVNKGGGAEDPGKRPNQKRGE
jgi:hypothetical protein